jgi:hypothetical protein
MEYADKPYDELEKLLHESDDKSDRIAIMLEMIRRDTKDLSVSDNKSDMTILAADPPDPNQALPTVAARFWGGIDTANKVFRVYSAAVKVARLTTSDATFQVNIVNNTPFSFRLSSYETDRAILSEPAIPSGATASYIFQNNAPTKLKAGMFFTILGNTSGTGLSINTIYDQYGVVHNQARFDATGINVGGSLVYDSTNQLGSIYNVPLAGALIYLNVMNLWLGTGNGGHISTYDLSCAPPTIFNNCKITNAYGSRIYITVSNVETLMEPTDSITLSGTLDSIYTINGTSAPGGSVAGYPASCYYNSTTVTVSRDISNGRCMLLAPQYSTMYLLQA